MRYVCILLLLTWLASCNQTNQKRVPIIVEELSLERPSTLLGLEKLSEYGFFKSPLKDLEPNEGVVPYDLNAPLFSDYAFKKRFIKFPTGKQARYDGTDVFEFPDGTVLIKTFYYPADFRAPEENLRLLETRLLLKDSGNWKALPYVWNEKQTEAYLNVAGGNIEVSWKHYNGEVRNVLYSVPNVNQCAGCHIRSDRIMPIGPTARQLNLMLEDSSDNQLKHLAQLGFLSGLPSDQLPKLVSYEDPQVPIDLRARSWLETNCAHCHRPDGPAKTSGLHLLADVSNPYELGVGKAPVAAGRGSGGLNYDIVPGQPEKSILYYRIKSSDPGVMMPELGKSLVHEEGVELVKHWIIGLRPQVN